MAKGQKFEVYQIIDRSIIVYAKDKDSAIKKARNRQDWSEREMVNGAYALQDHGSVDQDN